MATITLITPPEQYFLMEAGDRPNIGILSLASYIRSKGHIPIVSDLNHDSYKTLNNKIQHSDYIGMSTYTPYYNWITNFSKHLKFNYSDKPIIMGGPHATFEPNTLHYADFIIQGEGEEALATILDGNHNNKILKYPFRDDLDFYPSPYTEIDFTKYGMNQEGEKTMTLMTSRCCNYGCFFCAKTVMGNKQRFHSLERVFNDLEYLQENGFNSFYFLDDTFTQNKTRSLRFAQGIIDRKWDISFRYGTRTDKIDSETLDKMIEAGQRSISFGLEHMDNKVLKRMRKGETVEGHLRGIKLAKSKGLKVRGSFIINGPETNENTVYTTLSYAKEYLDYADFWPLIAYPGTPIWTHPEQFDVLSINRDFGFYQTGNKTNVEFKNMSSKQTEELVAICKENWIEHTNKLCPWEK